MKHYYHLGNEDRFYIWQAQREGKTQQAIANALGRHPSTICRELKPNTYAKSHFYTYYWAGRSSNTENAMPISRSLASSPMS